MSGVAVLPDDRCKDRVQEKVGREEKECNQTKKPKEKGRGK